MKVTDREWEAVIFYVAHLLDVWDEMNQSSAPNDTEAQLRMEALRSFFIKARSVSLTLKLATIQDFETKGPVQ